MDTLFSIFSFLFFEMLPNFRHFFSGFLHQIKLEQTQHLRTLCDKEKKTRRWLSVSFSTFCFVVSLNLFTSFSINFMFWGITTWIVLIFVHFMYYLYYITIYLLPSQPDVQWAASPWSWSSTGHWLSALLKGLLTGNEIMNQVLFSVR